MNGCTQYFENSLLIFLHIVKTGGTSLRWSLESNYRHARTMRCYKAQNQSLADVENMSDDCKRKVKLLSTHYGFGAHTLFPQSSGYVTMLRDPIKRTLSEYWAFHYPNLADKSQVENHFRDFVENMVVNKSDNTQVRFIAGATNEVKIDEQHLSSAVQNMDEYFFAVGIQEMYAESLALFCRVFGWPSITSVHCNKTGRPHQSAKELASKQQELLRQHNELDFQLYDYAKARLNSDLERYGLNDIEVAHLVKSSRIAKARLYGSRIVRKIIRISSRA